MKKDETIAAKTLTEAQAIAVRKSIAEDGYLLIKYFLLSMIERLNNLPPSKSFNLYKIDNKESIKPSIRYQLITEFKKQIDEFESGNIKPFRNYIDMKEEKVTVQIVLPGELGNILQYINDGTGVYGDYKTPIVPVEKEYMFIPGHKIAAGYLGRKEKKMGLNTSGQYTSGIPGRYYK